MGYLREYLAFALAELGPVVPTRLGNALRAAESCPGGDERWGLDAVFWWPRLCLLLPDSARNQVDEARASMDQSARQRNALTIGAPSGLSTSHQDQLAVAEQYAATAADVPIQAWCPGKAMLHGQLTDVACARWARHRQAHGGRGCLGTNMTSRGTSDPTYLGRSPLGPPEEHALTSLLTLNGLRVPEATGTDIEQLGLERCHWTLTITRIRAARSSPSRWHPAPPGRSTWLPANTAAGLSS